MSETSRVSSLKALRYRLEWFLCLIMVRTIPLLPRKCCVALAGGLGSLAYCVDRRGRTVALANLAAAFGSLYSEAQRKAIARCSYRNFARTMLDLFWGTRLNRENWRDYLVVDIDADAFREECQAQGAVLMCIHWGNFEWASLACGFMDIPTTIVTETFKNPSLSQFFFEGRGVAGHTIIPQENSMIRLLKVVKRKGMAGMLIDLNLRPDQAAVAIEGFGRKMSVTFLHAVLMQRGGAKMFPVHGEPLPDGRCRVVIDRPLTFPPDASPQQIAQLCWDHFEPRIRERPELYMWAYKHWRYRPRSASPADYPFYANVSSKFEKLLVNPPVSSQKRAPTSVGEETKTNPSV
ncbi:MAG: lysophospholipid acyltransferase family protein [Verrucomicrobiota bacterium]